MCKCIKSLIFWLPFNKTIFSSLTSNVSSVYVISLKIPKKLSNQVAKLKLSLYIGEENIIYVILFLNEALRLVCKMWF